MEIEQKLIEILNKDIYIPQKVSNQIKLSLKEEGKGVGINMKLKKVLATTIGIVLVGTTGVFAGKVIIDNMNSVDIAKEQGYFEKVDSDYIYHSGLGIRIENYFIDQGRVGVTFDVQSGEEFESFDLFNTTLTQNNTYSEEVEGRTVIHWDESESGLEYSNRYDIIKFVDKNGNEVRFDEDSIGGRGPEYKYEKLENNVKRALYTTPIYQEVTADKMKVNIKRVVTHKDGNIKEYIGDWEFEIKIADRYLNKLNQIEYKGTTNLEKVTVEKATLSATKLIVTLGTDNLEELLYGSSENKEPLYGGVQLHGGEGEYNNQEINTERSNYYDENKIVIKFDISKFNSEDSYKIILPSVDQEKEDLIITLNK